MSQGINLAKEVVNLLLEKGLTVATAESCTGGLVAKKITDVPGASACFHCGFVTYANEKKEKLLGVSAETLMQYGAVSQETALEMSQGVKRVAGADIGVSTTGIAGPDGGTKEKPVGLVYISICAKDFHQAYRLQLSGNREEVREQTSHIVLNMVKKYLLGNLDREDIL